VLGGRPSLGRAAALFARTPSLTKQRNKYALNLKNEDGLDSRWQHAGKKNGKGAAHWRAGGDGIFGRPEELLLAFQQEMLGYQN
jgi:hypothetical protein